MNVLSFNRRCRPAYSAPSLLLLLVLFAVVLLPCSKFRVIKAGDGERLTLSHGDSGVQLLTMARTRQLETT